MEDEIVGDVDEIDAENTEDVGEVEDYIQEQRIVEAFSKYDPDFGVKNFTDIGIVNRDPIPQELIESSKIKLANTMYNLMKKVQEYVDR